jgi:hypothetical protein
MNPAAGVTRRAPWGGAWVLVAGLCTTIAWYLPWFIVHYPWFTVHCGDTPLGCGPSARAVGPYVVASQDIHSTSVVVLLVVGVALIGFGIGFGIRSVAMRRAGSSRLDAVLLTIAAFALAAAVYYALGVMGTIAPGVYLDPEPGAFVMLAGIAAAVVACTRAWRRALGS